MSESLKIFHINMHKHWGGQPNRTLTECKELAQRGHDVTVSGPKGCMLIERAHAAGLKTFDDLELRRGFRPLSFWRDLNALTTLFRKENFDIVHTHGSQDTWIASFAAQRVRLKPGIVRSRHNTFPIASHVFNKWLYRHIIDHVITISPQVIPLLTEPGLCTEEKCTSIFSIPDHDRFHPEPPDEDLRKELGLKPEHLVVGSVARLAPEKGHRYLIDGAKKIVDEFPNVRFLFVGKGRSRKDLESHIAEAGLNENFILAGFRTDVPDLLNLMNIFVLCPISGESLGTSILEAFLTETPVVATDVGGVRESVRDGKTGFLVEAAAPEPLAEGILNLLRNPALQEKFGKAGRAMVREEFTPEQLARSTEDVYFKVLSSKM